MDPGDLEVLWPIGSEESVPFVKNRHEGDS
jgi:hypothetical protein